VGKNIVVNDYALQPFFVASVINEFAGVVRSTSTTNLDAYSAVVEPFTGGGPGVSQDTVARLKTGRIGTYGQFSVGVAGQLLNTGWLGYVRGDYRTGDRVEGWGISGGLRYQFTPEAIARPLVTKGDAPILAPLDGPVNWSGFSLGGSAGGLWSKTRQVEAAFSLDDINTVHPHAAGVYAGGQVGLDYQVNNIVFGVAGDAGWTNARGGRACSAGAGGYVYSCETNLETLYMATGRVGYALDRSLFYVKGGAAFADTRDTQKSNFNGQPLFILSTGQFPNSTVSAFATGWTIGAGFEFAITKNWTAKAEYMHYELESRRYAFPTQANQAFLSTQNTGDIVKVGVNYRFTFDAPVVAPAARPVIAKY
jgi:opacity protein-like surface antigen